MEEDYKEKIIELVEKIDNAALLKTIYNFIFSLKKKWGI